MRTTMLTLALWLLVAAVACAQEPELTVDPIGFEEPDDSGFTALFWLMIPLAIAGAFVGLRRDWHAGTFFGRSRIHVTSTDDPLDRPDLDLSRVTTPERTTEQRLAEIERLEDRGLISDEERAKLRAQVLEDL